MDDVEGILSSIGYPAFFGKYVPGFVSNGKAEVQVPCLFHEDKPGKKKLHINIEKGFYHCKIASCGASGNAVQFVERLFNLGFPEAVKKIKSDFGINGNEPPLPKKEHPTPKQKVACLSLSQINNLNLQLTKKTRKPLRRSRPNMALMMRPSTNTRSGFKAESM